MVAPRRPLTAHCGGGIIRVETRSHSVGRRRTLRNRRPSGAPIVTIRPLITLLALLLSAFLATTVALAFDPPYPESAGFLRSAAVLRVVDGDTVDVLLDGNVERLRLIGIDTPETVDPRKVIQCFGVEASRRAKQLLQPGRTVVLEDDESQDVRDKYGRLLSYVWLDDGRLFNYEMVSEGFAHEYTYFLPYRHREAFKAAEADARANSRGFWAPSTCNGDTEQASPDSAGAEAFVAASPCDVGQIKGNRNSGIYHVPRGAFYRATRANVECFDFEGEARAAGFRPSSR